MTSLQPIIVPDDDFDRKVASEHLERALRSIHGALLTGLHSARVIEAIDTPGDSANEALRGSLAALERGLLVETMAPMGFPALVLLNHLALTIDHLDVDCEDPPSSGSFPSAGRRNYRFARSAAMVTRRSMTFA